MARLGALLALALTLASPAARAFDYLEHAYFADRACYEAQRRLAPLVTPARPDVVARYLALALACPERWDRPYCADDLKQAEAGLNRLEAPPAASGDHALTLGDFSALVDHLAWFGPVGGFPRARQPGLTAEVLALLGAPTTSGGLIEDVAEEACDSGVAVPWDRVEHDVRSALAASDASGAPVAVPPALLAPNRRASPHAGPVDPAALLSFNNPHYLDLKLHGDDHFGVRAFGAWTGYHTAARVIAASRCQDVLAVDADLLEDLADGLPAFARVDFDDLAPAERARQGCLLLAERVRRRLLDWRRRAEPALTAPAAPFLDAFADGPATTEEALLLEHVVTALMAVVWEGGGLHFLQDGLSGGHLRTDPTSRAGLGEIRYAHDTDGQFGLSAVLTTAAGHAPFVAYGDGFLLGRPTGALDTCVWDRLGDAGQPDVTACLVQHQRGLLVALGAASLVDWALGGVLQAPRAAADGCSTPTDAPHAFVCRFLPLRAVAAAGYEPQGPPPTELAEGTLPTPPPPFAYQSLLTVLAADFGGDGVQAGARLVFLSELDDLANWMSSWHFGLLTTQGVRRSELLAEFSFMFHWRWAARFLVNAGPVLHAGWRGFGDDVSTFVGLGPSVGLTFLPEGWTKIPLEATFSLRLPVTLLDSRFGAADGVRIEGWWFEIGVGLAFM